MENKINCVEMKHKSASKIHEQIKALNLKDELTFWEKKSNELKNKKLNLKKQIILHASRLNTISNSLQHPALRRDR